MKTKSASIEAMEILHEKLASELLNQLENGVKATDKKGNVVELSTPSATLNVIRQFCKDNNITALPEENEDLNKLANLLPFNGTVRAVND